MKYFLSLAEQVGGVYLLTFVSLLLADGTDLTNVSILQSSAVAAIPAALAVVKGALARNFGDRDSANFTG